MKKHLLSLFAASLLFVGCQQHFIQDAKFRQTVKSDFEEKLQTLELPTPLTNIMSETEKEMLEFMYAYMPISDIADQSPTYFLQNARLSLLAQREMSWGKKVPELLFRHFVLPLRINNENLDQSRAAFYHELKSRIKELSMYDAILEVNHWCHEKVKYAPCDARTLSPLSVVKTAIGRCGEESTFTVAALRSVGIPARQVYTPRWAHTDDNHAWVEAWADGKWYFLGACEPEPVLNLGWFNAPASRGMLMHTKVFGKYNGPEEVMRRTANYTEINVIDNYAETGKAQLRITDAQGNPVPNAKVEFKIYNYAEFYTVATKTCDSEGRTFLTAGKGDMLVWASHKDHFGYQKVSFGKDQEIVIALTHKNGDELQASFDIVPPPEKYNLPEVSKAQRAENSRRMAHEDSIREAYESTFFHKESAKQWVEKNHFSPATAALLVTSRGNHKALTTFLLEAQKKEMQERAEALLNVITTKDLHDIPLNVLQDHLNNSIESKNIAKNDFKENILNPRIGHEMLSPYKGYLQKAINDSLLHHFQAHPKTVSQWVKTNIIINNTLNAQHILCSPIGVWKLKMADERSREIFYVALMRTCGIPAWIDKVTGKTQYKEGTQIYDVNFEKAHPSVAVQGKLTLSYQPDKVVENPKYFRQFTLAKIAHTTPQLLNYEEGEVDMGGGVSWKSTFKAGNPMDAGYYMLTTGTRMADGSVLSTLKCFNIKAEKNATIPLELRKKSKEVQVIGRFNSENNFLPQGKNKAQSLLSVTGRGYYIIGVLGVNQEPTNHALKDLGRQAKELEKWGRKIILLFPDQESVKRFKAQEFKALPNTVIYGIDINHKIQKEMVQQMKLNTRTLPIFLIADTFNRVVFSSQGYTIGLGHQMMETIHHLK